MADEDYGSKAVWFMAGIAIGATVALLYAPATGEETRRTIVKRTKEGRDAICRFGQRYAGSRQGDVRTRAANWPMKRRICSSAGGRSWKAPQPI